MLHSGHGELLLQRSTMLISKASPVMNRHLNHGRQIIKDQTVFAHLPYSTSKPSFRACALALCPPPVSLIRHMRRLDVDPIKASYEPCICPEEFLNVCGLVPLSFPPCCVIVEGQLAWNNKRSDGRTSWEPGSRCPSPTTKSAEMHEYSTRLVSKCL